MTKEDKIEIVEDVSDVFLEFSKYFNVEMEISESGYGLNIETESDKITKILDGSTAGFSRSINSGLKFKISSKWAVRNDWENKRKQKFLKNTTKYLISKLPIIEERLSLVLGGYEINFLSKIAVISPGKGLIVLPLLEMDKDNIEHDSKFRMNSNGYDFSSYEKNIDEITSSDDIQVSHVHVTFMISESKQVLKTKELESKSKFSKIIRKFNIFKKS